MNWVVGMNRCTGPVPCTVCGKPPSKHGSYPTCATHPYTSDRTCQHVLGATCVGLECINGCVRGRARVEPVAGPSSEPARSNKNAPESSSAAPVEAVEVRSPKDYAIEHAGYMATTAKHLLAAINEEDRARMVHDERDSTLSGRILDDRMATRGEAFCSLRNDIYEFEKRRDRARTLVAQPPQAARRIEDCPELNLSNYDAEDVARLNDWAVRADAEIDSLTRKPLGAGLHPVMQEALAPFIRPPQAVQEVRPLTEDESILARKEQSGRYGTKGSRPYADTLEFSAVIQRKFCEVNGLKLAAISATTKEN